MTAYYFHKLDGNSVGNDGPKGKWCCERYTERESILGDREAC